MTGIHRRNVLVGLLCSLGLAGCAKGGLLVRRPWVNTTVRLGWRWIPGMRMRYRTTVSNQGGEAGPVHMEEWNYVVRAVNEDGLARLEGRRTGFAIIEDKEISAQGKYQKKHRIDSTGSGMDTVELLMGPNGVYEVPSTHSFAAFLPHLRRSRLPTGTPSSW